MFKSCCAIYGRAVRKAKRTTVQHCRSEAVSLQLSTDIVDDMCCVTASPTLKTIYSSGAGCGGSDRDLFSPRSLCRLPNKFDREVVRFPDELDELADACSVVLKGSPVSGCLFPANHVSSNTRSSSKPGFVPGRIAARRYLQRRTPAPCSQ